MNKRLQTRAQLANQHLSNNKLSALITVVNRTKADFYMDLIQSFHVNMQMAMLANGTASKQTLAYLGLANTEKTVILSIVREDMIDKILEVLEEKFNTIKGGKGIAYTVPMAALIGVASFTFLSDIRDK
jgi:hypothetical protein